MRALTVNQVGDSRVICRVLRGYTENVRPVRELMELARARYRGGLYPLAAYYCEEAAKQSEDPDEAEWCRKCAIWCDAKFSASISASIWAPYGVWG